jgi:hypothetical protein
MSEMAAAMGGPGGLGAAAGGGGLGGAALGGMDPAAMASLGARLSDPAMVESMSAMLSSMDPTALASMLSASGLPPAQAEAMAAQVKKLSPSQLATMMKVAGKAQAALGAARRVKAALASRAGLLMGIAVLLLALWLRWRGIM